jgi:hypothetical protein
MASGSVLRGVSDGFVRDLDHPARPLGGTDVTAARGTLRVLLNEGSELRVTGDFSYRDPVPLFYSKVLAVKPGFTVDNPADLHEVRTSTPAESRHMHYGGSLVQRRRRDRAYEPLPRASSITGSGSTATSAS